MPKPKNVNTNEIITSKFKDLFISYGRRESLVFVGRLHQQLKLAGYDAWFDKVNIPDGDDYVQRINHGIESAPDYLKSFKFPTILLGLVTT